jgi:hypothetical protein
MKTIFLILVFALAVSAHRYYDAAVAKWTSIDPANQFFSAYAYSPNPLIGTDVDGNEYMVGDQGQYLAGPPQNPSDPSVFYGSTKIGEIGGTLDITAIYNNFLTAEQNIARGILNPLTFAALVRTDGQWDIKENPAYIYSAGTFLNSKTMYNVGDLLIITPAIKHG